MNRFIHMSFATLFAIAMVGSSLAVGQDHFIGDDKPVSRVIKLRSSTKFVPAAKADTTTSRKAPQSQGTATVPPVLSNPSDIKFDSLAAPASLKTTSNGFQVRPPKQQTPKLPARRVAPIWNGPSIPAMHSANEAKRPVNGPLTNGLHAKPAGHIAMRGSNLVETTVRAPKFVNLNQPATIEISLRNQGSNAVENAVLIATIPMHARLASSTPTPIRHDGQTVQFSIPRIGGQETKQVTMNLIPTQKQTMEIGTVIRVENTQRSMVAVRQPIIKLSLNGPNHINIGKKVSHELVVSNVGDGVATDVRLDTVVPPHLKKLSESNGTYIRSIEPGKSVRVQYESLAIAPGKHNLTASVAATGCQAEQAALSFDVFQPELRVSAVGPKLNFVQRDGIYTINIENTGVVDVTDTRIALRVPEGMKVTTISRQAGVDAKKGILTWNFDRIEANSTEQIQLKATALQPGEQVCNIQVTSNETQEKEILLATQIVTRADLSVRIKNVTGPVQVGTKAQFQVVVENNGSQQAEDVNVRIVLPESLMAVDDNQVANADSSIAFEEPMVAPGQKVTFNFTAVGVTKGEHVVRSVLEAEGTQRQIIAEDMVYVYDVAQTRVSEAISPAVIR